MSAEPLNSREALKYLGIPKKNFENYYKFSGEIKSIKKNGSYFFEKVELDRWATLRESRTVYLTMAEYEKCFELAIQMAYSKGSSSGTGIRGVRSEMQQADDWILGILAEFGLKKFLKKYTGKSVVLDSEPHPEEGITAQDLVEFDGREPRIGVAVKSSKEKSCFNVIPPIEYENDDRKSDVYVFARVMLPSDHLFRILGDHSFFKTVREKINKKVAEQEVKIAALQVELGKVELSVEKMREKSKMVTKTVRDRAEAASQRDEIKNKINERKNEIENLKKKISNTNAYKKMDSLPEKIPIWICGYNDHEDLEKVSEIPGQKFEGKKGEEVRRYVKSVSGMKNSDDDWKNFVGRL